MLVLIYNKVVIYYNMGWSQDPGPPKRRGSSPLFFCHGGVGVKELSVFVDESGDFGEYSSHSPYYIITMILHEQDVNIDLHMAHLEHELSMLGFPQHCIHTGPIIRQEEEYRYVDLETRRKIFNKMVAFVRQINIRYKTFWIKKKHIEDEIEATGKLAKLISMFIKDNYDEFLTYTSIKVYYDNGQIEVNKILSTVFHILLQSVEFRRVLPSNYRLFQVADLICTFELLRLKMEKHNLSKSEKLFFGSERDLKKNYLKQITKKAF